MRREREKYFGRREEYVAGQGQRTESVPTHPIRSNAQWMWSRGRRREEKKIRSRGRNRSNDDQCNPKGSALVETKFRLERNSRGSILRAVFGSFARTVTQFKVEVMVRKKVAARDLCGNRSLGTAQNMLLQSVVVIKFRPTFR